MMGGEFSDKSGYYLQIKIDKDGDEEMEERLLGFSQRKEENQMVRRADMWNRRVKLTKMEMMRWRREVWI